MVIRTETPQNRSPESQVGVWGNFAKPVWLLALLFCIFSYVRNNHWQLENEIATAAWLSSILLIAFVVILGVTAVFRDWDGKVRGTSGWDTWVFLFAIALSAVAMLAPDSFAIPNATVASLGLVLTLVAMLRSHRRKGEANAKRGSFQPYTIVALALLIVPNELAIPAWRFVEFSICNAAQTILGLLGMPFQYSSGTFLIESGTVEISALQLDLAFRGLLAGTLLYMAKLGRSWLALPAYCGSTLLWTMTIGLVQLIYVCKFTANSWFDWGLMSTTVCLFLLASGMIASTDRLLRVLLFEMPLDSPARANNPLSHLWNSWFQGMTFTDQESLVHAGQRQSNN